MKTYLVAHDFSAFGDAAIAQASELAKLTKGKLILLHVHPPEVVPPGQQTGESTYNDILHDNAELQTMSDDLKAHGVEVEIESVIGEPAKQILAEAERRAVDMVVMGTHGRKGISALLLGSVAEKIVREAKMPVLVVKAPAEA
jgi:nucleotide-binding universal stress UspA family protein